jgi:hypothetical protein
MSVPESKGSHPDCHPDTGHSLPPLCEVVPPVSCIATTTAQQSVALDTDERPRGARLNKSAFAMRVTLPCHQGPHLAARELKGVAKL